MYIDINVNYSFLGLSSAKKSNESNTDWESCLFFSTRLKKNNLSKLSDELFFKSKPKGHQWILFCLISFFNDEFSL